MYIKFNDMNEALQCTVVPQENIVTLRFPCGNEPTMNTSGFRLYLNAEMQHDISGDSYEGFITIYRNDEETAKYNGYQLSNDGSAYKHPIPIIRFESDFGGELEGGDQSQEAEYYEDLEIPITTPNQSYVFVKWEPEIPTSGKIENAETFIAIFKYDPSLEEVKDQKIAEMNQIQQEMIRNGVEVTLTDGTTERFTLKDQDQMSLMGLQTLAQQEIEQIPWHEADNAEHCKYYSAEDMNRITGAALTFISYQVTYFRDLRIYINSMEDKETVEAATYGMYIPMEYQSEVLADFYSAKNA